MHKLWTTTGIKRHSFLDKQRSRQLRMAATLLALPLSLLSLLPKSVLAAAPTRPLNVKHATAVAQPQAPRSHHSQERAAAQREAMRYEEARRAAQRKRWSPAWAQGVRSAAITLEHGETALSRPTLLYCHGSRNGKGVSDGGSAAGAVG